MKKMIFYLLYTVLISNQIHATEQQSDILYYANEKLTIDIGWGHPSPLETYYLPWQRITTNINKSIPNLKGVYLKKKNKKSDESFPWYRIC